jgi:hypothetical protein
MRRVSIEKAGWVVQAGNSAGLSGLPPARQKYRKKSLAGWRKKTLETKLAAQQESAKMKCG